MSTLSSILDTVFFLLDWSPNATSTQITRVEKFVNLAVRQLVKEVPEAFMDVGADVWVDPSYIAASDTDRISVLDSDPWVMVQVLPASTDSDTKIPALTDGTWDYRTLEIEDSDGVWHQRRIRSVFTYNDGADDYVAFALESPWLNGTDTELNYRVYLDEVYLPRHVFRLLSAQMIIDGTKTQPVRVITTAEAEQIGLFNRPDIVAATPIPKYIYQTGHAHVETPQFTPVATAFGSWNGPAPAGAFEFVYTVCRGRRPATQRFPGPKTNASVVAGADRWMPLLESNPSPVSNRITATYSTSGIKLSLPDVDFMLGFGDAATARYHNAGTYIRVYVRRVTAVGGSNTNIETRERFYLLGEATSYSKEFTWTGDILPDQAVPLQSINQYVAFALHPRIQERSRLAIRYTMRPPELTDDQDSPELDDFSDAIAFLAAGLYANSVGDYDRGRNNLALYKNEKDNYRKSRASLIPPNQTVKRKLGTTRRL